MFLINRSLVLFALVLLCPGFCSPREQLAAQNFRSCPLVFVARFILFLLRPARQLIAPIPLTAAAFPDRSG
jgi:hypothetical protein